jgi:acetyltransferase-like isoleucine patch superfamily enzyme
MTTRASIPRLCTRLIFKIIRYLKERSLEIISVVSTYLQFLGNNVTVGKGWIAYGVPRIVTHGKGNIVIGNKFKFNSGKHFNIIGRNQDLTFQIWGSLVIGDNVRLSGTAIICKKQVIIGDNVMIGGNVAIYDTDFHSMDHYKRNHDPEDRSDVVMEPVTIRDGAFIGAHSTILKGVTIGEKAIIGAGSVVTKNIPDLEIWAGNPAKFIRKIQVL